MGNMGTILTNVTMDRGGKEGMMGAMGEATEQQDMGDTELLRGAAGEVSATFLSPHLAFLLYLHSAFSNSLLVDFSLNFL